MAVFSMPGFSNTGAASFGGHYIPANNEVMMQGMQGTQAASLQRAQQAHQAALQAQQLGQNQHQFDTLQANKAATRGSLMSLLQQGGSPGGGYGGPGPQITTGPVWDQGMINNQVNTSRAQGDQAAAQQMADNASKTAGQGFGSHSPLLMALNNGVQMGNTANNATNEQQIRWGAAQGNATQNLNSQKANADVYVQRQDEEIRRQATQNQFRSALAAALSGL